MVNYCQFVTDVALTIPTKTQTRLFAFFVSFNIY